MNETNRQNKQNSNTRDLLRLDREDSSGIVEQERRQGVRSY